MVTPKEIGILINQDFLKNSSTTQLMKSKMFNSVVLHEAYHALLISQGRFMGRKFHYIPNIDMVNILTTDVIAGQTSLSAGITTTSSTINVDSTKGFPKQYGLVKIEALSYLI